MNFYDILFARKLAGGGGDIPPHSYQLKNIENTPTDIATFNASALPMPSLTVGIEATQSGSGDPSPENIRPISGWSEANVSVCGKNLVESTLTNTTINTIGEINVSGGSATFDMHIAKIIKGETYTIQSDESQNVNQKFVGGFFYDMPQLGSISYNNSRLANTPATFTAPIDGYVAFRTSHNYAFAQIEIGSTATTYEPYNGHTYTIDLDGTRYGCTLDVVSGELVVDRIGVDLGSLTWSGSLSVYHYYTSLSIPYKWANNTQFICSKYKFDGRGTGGNYYGVSGTFRYWYSEGGTPVYEIYVCDETHTFSSFTEVKEYLSGTMLVYELATPQTIQLTPTAVKSLLGTNNLWADSGDINEGSYFVAI
jgi:hypothetical protein